MSVVGRGIRDAFRSATRMVAIVWILALSIGLGFVMLIGHKAVQNKIGATLATIGNTVAITPAGSNPGTTTNRYLSQRQLNKVAHLPHVVALDEALPGTLPSPTKPGRRSDGSRRLRSISPGQPVCVVGTTDPSNLAIVGAPTLSLVTGHQIDGAGNSDDALISAAMAKRNHLSAGSHFTAYGVAFTVSGIFDSDTATGNNTVVVPLATEQRLTHHDHDVARAIATADSLTNLAAVTGEITFALGPGANVTSDVAAAGQALAPLASVESLSRYSLAGAIGAAAVISFVVMMLTVRERKREIGILKAIGAPNSSIMGQFVSEALTFGVIAGAVGLLTGALCAGAITTSLVGTRPNVPADPRTAGNPALDHLSLVHVTAGVTDVLIGLTGVTLIAAVGSAVATYLIAKIHPAEALRSE